MLPSSIGTLLECVQTVCGDVAHLSAVRSASLGSGPYQAAEKPLVESAIDLISCDQSRHAERGCRMRGRDHQRGHLGGYVDPEAMVPADHPLRQIRPLVNTALARLSPEFDQLYALTGRPSIPPEQYVSRLFSIVDYFSTRPRMPTQADHSSIDSIGSLLAWMLNPLINMILMHPGGG